MLVLLPLDLFLAVFVALSFLVWSGLLAELSDVVLITLTRGVWFAVCICDELLCEAGYASNREEEVFDVPELNNSVEFVGLGCPSDKLPFDPELLSFSLNLLCSNLNSEPIDFNDSVGFEELL